MATPPPPPQASPRDSSPSGFRGPRRPRIAPTPAERNQGVTVIGAPRLAMRDFYYLFLRVRWSLAIAAITAAYLALNAVFALAYRISGGVGGADPDSFFDAF